MPSDSDISMERHVIQYLHTLQTEYEYRNLKNSEYDFKNYTVDYISALEIFYLPLSFKTVEKVNYTHYETCNFCVLYTKHNRLSSFI